MSSSKTTANVALLLFAFFSLLVTQVYAGTATAWNDCSYSVYCAVVKENGGVANFQEVRPGNKVTVDIMSLPNGDGYTIMCKPTNTPNAPVTQIEFTRNDDTTRRLHFDLSTVAGAVFVNDGMTMYVDEPRNSDFPTCYGAVCRAGENPCQYAYTWDGDSKHGERACSTRASIQWHMCLVDENLSLPPPGTGAKVE
ncbi:uncharacterized protein AB675_9612 [Cyphellophora attinorum]|uniref:Antigenic thaumatin-like protein n=1 Tax=Cyphellophora attinorum TaxID=1664694 RepID=A0A0N1H7A6_9EURO|nr:uncharacterized protein AB675_9612 [Phialophora attinorum]KPI42335.1 hypothetical protein AB675_9612 [Phialophora attinorum]